MCSPSTGFCGGVSTMLPPSGCGWIDDGDGLRQGASLMTETTALLRAASVCKDYQNPDHIGRLVLDHLDFTLGEGEIVAVLGKSGSGKSTFLRILAGLIPASDGMVEYRGAPVTGPAHGVAMVFQSFALF